MGDLLQQAAEVNLLSQENRRRKQHSMPEGDCRTSPFPW